jgi:hypothetical protein
MSLDREASDFAAVCVLALFIGVLLMVIPS